MPEDRYPEGLERVGEITDNPAFFNMPPEAKEKFFDAFRRVYEETGDEDAGIQAGWDAVEREYEYRGPGRGAFEVDLDGE